MLNRRQDLEQRVLKRNFCRLLLSFLFQGRFKSYVYTISQLINQLEKLLLY